MTKKLSCVIMLGLALCCNVAFAQTVLTPYEQSLHDANVNNALLHAQQSQLHFQNSNAPSSSTPRLLLADSDNDGMPDTWETTYGLNINDAKDAWGDLDNDKVVNLFEYQLGSLPNDPASPTAVNVLSGDDVSSAISTATAGQIIRVQGGTYNVNYQTFTPKTIMIQGGWNAAFTVYNPMVTPTIFDGQNLGEVLYFSWNIGTSNMVLDGVTLTRGKEAFGAFNFYMNGSATSNLCIKDCQIINSSSTFDFGGALNIMHKDSSYSEVFVVNTLIAHDSSSGIYNQTVDKGNAKWQLINNTITDNYSLDTDEGYGVSGFTLYTPSNISIIIKNAIVWGNQRDAVSFVANGGPVTITASYADIDVVTTGLGITYTPGTGMIDQDPLFVNPVTIDFHLTAPSPCINAGVNVGLPFIGTAPDMGAFESNVGSGIEEANAPTIGIYPNPFHTTAVMTVDSEIAEANALLQIFDITGRMLKTMELTINAGNCTIDRGELVNGLYYYQLSSKQSVIGSGKFMVQ
jgi:hypothetical protein